MVQKKEKQSLLVDDPPQKNKEILAFNRDFLKFFYRYGIFWMPPGESSHPGGSEYV